ncbi:UNVERIFIED_CONTAM: hypothetical protein PYX00_001714 [Menopon gallinae]|uniref:Uncharacterized protein n=1 Tax=Menopon gallinae TaxID=328185 RepID=A0AAW2IDY8_9NEOP
MVALFLVLVLSHAPGLLAEEEYYGSISRLEQCSGADNLTVKFNTLYMNYNGDTRYTLTFNLTCSKPLDKPMDMMFEVRKCATEHGPCEDFLNHTIENLCTELETEGSIPATLFVMAGLPAKCPIPKGDYVTEKTEIKIHPELLAMGRFGNYWQFKLQLAHPTPSGPDILLCLYVEGRVATVKAKKLKRRKGR